MSTTLCELRLLSYAKDQMRRQPPLSRLCGAIPKGTFGKVVCVRVHCKADYVSMFTCVGGRAQTLRPTLTPFSSFFTRNTVKVSRALTPRPLVVRTVEPNDGGRKLKSSPRPGRQRPHAVQSVQTAAKSHEDIKTMNHTVGISTTTELTMNGCHRMRPLTPCLSTRKG